MMYEFHRRLQYDCCKAASDTHNERKDEHHILLRHLLQKVSQRRKNILYYKSRLHRFEQSRKYTKKARSTKKPTGKFRSAYI